MKRRLVKRITNDRASVDSFARVLFPLEVALEDAGVDQVDDAVAIQVALEVDFL